MDKFQIFISYRRDGGEFLAGRVSDKLSDMGYSVFYDIESMRSGAFNNQIYSAIDQCEDVLLVLPPNGLDRCADEGDWVRKEIEYALNSGKNIIPLLMNGFQFPNDMPTSIAPVAMREGVLVDSHYFDAVINRICTLMASKPHGPSEKESEELKNGVRFLSRKMYAQASACFEREICNNMSSPEAYFYAAVAKLDGKRPFLASRSAIGEIEKYIDSAIAYGERALYYYFYAYVKNDHYESKMLKTTPSSAELLRLSISLGITEAEKTELFDLLGVTRPAGF